MKTLTLNTGAKIPIVGFGVWQIKNSNVGQAINYALKSGYRHIDTAKIYRNETGVGKAIKNSNLDRKQIFVTTKLWITDFFNPLKAIKTSLKKLNLDYVDLYLIHWPTPFWKTAWKGLELIYHQGLAKAIGVSNFNLSQLKTLENQSGIVPAVNQIEFSPFNYNQKLIEYCHQKGIIVEAYSPLTQGKRLQNQNLKTIALKYNRSVAQVLLRWCLQHNVVVLPRSQNPDHIKENIDIFDFQISSGDVAKLDSLNENYRSLFDYVPRK